MAGRSLPEPPVERQQPPTAGGVLQYATIEHKAPETLRKEEIMKRETVEYAMIMQRTRPMEVGQTSKQVETSKSSISRKFSKTVQTLQPPQRKISRSKSRSKSPVHHPQPSGIPVTTRTGGQAGQQRVDSRSPAKPQQQQQQQQQQSQRQSQQLQRPSQQQQQHSSQQQQRPSQQQQLTHSLSKSKIPVRPQSPPQHQQQQAEVEVATGAGPQVRFSTGQSGIPLRKESKSTAEMEKAAAVPKPSNLSRSPYSYRKSFLLERATSPPANSEPGRKGEPAERTSSPPVSPEPGRKVAKGGGPQFSRWQYGDSVLYCFL